MGTGRADHTSLSTAGWIVLVLAGFATAAADVVLDWYVLFAHSSTCNDPPDPAEMHAGRIALLVVLVVSAVPWLVLAAFARPRGTIAVVAAVALLPAFAAFIYGLHDGAWVGGFCF